MTCETISDSHYLLNTKGSLKFQVGEFDNSLNKVQELIDAIGKDLGITVPEASSVENAVKWLNSRTEPFGVYVKLKGDNKLSANQSKVIDAVVETLSVQTRELIEAKNWAELAKMPDGQPTVQESDINISLPI